MFSVFWLQVTLTERGLANWMYVVGAIFKYLNMLRTAGPQKRIFDEIKQTAYNEYG
jgi:secreted Zn-dependent insulinase-like peptidase